MVFLAERNDYKSVLGIFKAKKKETWIFFLKTRLKFEKGKKNSHSFISNLMLN